MVLISFLKESFAYNNATCILRYYMLCYALRVDRQTSNSIAALYNSESTRALPLHKSVSARTLSLYKRKLQVRQAAKVLLVLISPLENNTLHKELRVHILQ
jgi:hypothetical protein